MDFSYSACVYILFRYEVLLLKLKIKDGYVIRQIAGTWVSMPTGNRASESSTLFTLSDSAVFLWNLLIEGIQIDDLIMKITEEYDVDEQGAKKDLEKYLEHLKTNDLLED